MKILTISELERITGRVEAAVDATDGIDHWCSGPDWVLSVAAGFAPDAQHLIIAAGHGFALLAHYETDRGTPVIAGMEPLWGFAFPLVGPEPAALAAAVADHLQTRTDWRIVVLFGAPPQEHPLTQAVIDALSAIGDVRCAPGIVRQVADLRTGYDAWLTRRSTKFRRALLRAVRAFDQDPSLVIEDVSADPNLFDRLLAIERRSWKGREESGITSPQMSATYATIIDRLQARGRAQAHVARRVAPATDGRSSGSDLGYILGGVRHRIYRGLQLSYATEAADLGVGNVLQHHQLRLLCQTDRVDRYDMGMDFDYKRRWADSAVPSTTIVVIRDPSPTSSSPGPSDSP